MCGQHNVRASAEDNTEIKISDPAGNRTRAAGLEGMDSTDHATATDFSFIILLLLRVFTLPQPRAYTPRDLQPKCPWVRCL